MPHIHKDIDFTVAAGIFAALSAAAFYRRQPRLQFSPLDFRSNLAILLPS